MRGSRLARTGRLRRLPSRPDERPGRRFAGLPAPGCGPGRANGLSPVGRGAASAFWTDWLLCCLGLPPLGPERLRQGPCTYADACAKSRTWASDPFPCRTGKASCRPGSSTRRSVLRWSLRPRSTDSCAVGPSGRCDPASTFANLNSVPCLHTARGYRRCPGLSDRPAARP